MNTRRTRMLIVVISAAIAVSMFIRWDPEGWIKDFRQGYQDGYHAVGRK